MYVTYVWCSILHTYIHKAVFSIMQKDAFLALTVKSVRVRPPEAGQTNIMLLLRLMVQLKPRRAVFVYRYICAMMSDCYILCKIHSFYLCSATKKETHMYFYYWAYGFDICPHNLLHCKDLFLC